LTSVERPAYTARAMKHTSRMLSILGLLLPGLPGASAT
jgi:hypothetical protein